MLSSYPSVSSRVIFNTKTGNLKLIEQSQGHLIESTGWAMQLEEKPETSKDQEFMNESRSRPDLFWSREKKKLCQGITLHAGFSSADGPQTDIMRLLEQISNYAPRIQIVPMLRLPPDVSPPIVSEYA